MTAFTSTAYSRDLGDELRRLRVTCTGLNGRALATKLGWDPSKVSNIEHGRARASEIDLTQLFTACGKDLDFLEEFKRRYHHAFDQYFAQVPTELRTLAMTESTAKKIIAYDVLMITGLLQTEAYARELMIEKGIETPENIKKGVELRIQRQTIMRRQNRPECVFYIHELALQMRLGDAQLMEEQYLRLLFNTHMLRIVPVGARTAALLSKCILFEFEKALPTVVSPTDTAMVFAQDSAAVERARNTFARLDAIALDEEQSRKKLAEYVSGLRGDLHGSGTDLA
ncbi:helix-turn-helix transcriptional regulator [Lentzea sp. NPDC005914]|uniref:helix-turn-helix domain-containing protein n=1 Tax=Lentzea sp. NPDC005914 TaxID=3154572 RepID=UPI0033EC5C22